MIKIKNSHRNSSRLIIVKSLINSMRHQCEKKTFYYQAAMCKESLEIVSIQHIFPCSSIMMTSIL